MCNFKKIAGDFYEIPNILTSIEEIVKGHFGELFEIIESFYLKNFLILIQGLLTQTNTSVSGMTLNSLNALSHTTLTRFLRGYNPFWENLQKALWNVLGSKTQSKRILVLDDTLVERKGKQIPHASKQYDHCQNRYTKGQIVLTIGELLIQHFPLKRLSIIMPSDGPLNHFSNLPSRIYLFQTVRFVLLMLKITSCFSFLLLILFFGVSLKLLCNFHEIAQRPEISLYES
jgi:hypothetical protein